MRRVLLYICLVLLLPGNVLAASDIVATYKYSDGTMVTLVTRDKDHVRMDTSATSYMLLSKGKVYSVNCEDGQCQVMDMGAMMNSGLGSMFGGGGDTDYEVRYEKTGRTETVAGYKGVVYEAVTFENGKVVSRDEMVLSNHSNIKKLTEGWIAMAEVMTQSMGDSFDDSLDEARKMGYGGMLRMGDDMRLHKLAVRNLDSAYYRLPANSQQVQTGTPPQQSGSDMGIEDDAKDIGYDAKEATKDEIKGGIRDAISDLFQ
ncbi:hypothetical protein [Pseudodesulfovibrio portus]|uniref:DUF4412 domain-containing protein n=1 Tax=Pseudodesulfovibrio portus TaxID=231439 RepID=A0ABM8ASE5_9BACT|nr:hypothetical protein [Pseudodesulfovibrio portus]BDQ34358.1 hypothetical protein JCM14722_19000 [Pseudodesulfovibrio portus]